MIQLGFSDINQQIDTILDLSVKLRPEPVRFYKYLKRVLDEDWRLGQPSFPVDIRIAKANKYLLKGDYEPAQVIHLDAPILMEDGTPFWFRSSASGVNLRFGYENLDAREISKFQLDMKFIHAFMGGSSGHGKSVTLNSMIGAICYEYAPWEVELHLSDAKIVEFKKYGIGHRIPHISSIAATEDADYVISVLSRAEREMNERAKIFGNLSVSSLASFRKKTGLVLPRVIVIMDEVESTFRLAGRQASIIADKIDSFARLGRAAGYHVFMATQNLSSDIPKSAMGQVRIRCCLGANEATSQAVLGNSGATENIGRIGKLVVNTEVMAGGDTTPFNVKFQTPLLEDEEFETEMESLEAKGKEVGFKRIMSFYDEGDVKTVDQFDPVIDSAFARMQAAGEIGPRMVPIILGAPAFVTDDTDELLKIWLDQKDIENILIASTAAERVAAHMHNITKCLHASGYVIQLFTTELDQAPWAYKPFVAAEARNADASPLSTIEALVRKRLFLLQLDQLSDSVRYDRAKVEKIFADDKLPSSAWGNELLCKRAVVFYSSLMPKNNHEWDDIRYLFPTFLEVYKEFEKTNCLIKRLSPTDFTKAVFVIGDLAKIVGYGRDTKTRYVSTLKKAMQDACRVGILYVAFTRSMEGLTDLVSGFRYTIFDLPDTKDWARMRTEAPFKVAPVLSVLFDIMDNENPQKKFKRTLLREEV